MAPRALGPKAQGAIIGGPDKALKALSRMAS